MHFDWMEVGGMHAVEVRPLDGRVRSVLIATVLGIIATVMAGCGEGCRERFMAARVNYVVPHAGDGSTRVSMWPLTSSERTQMAQAMSQDVAGMR
ncbi:MAG: hypothetical protein WC718_03545 [Phycisphaerales bacterium]|jgi:hypothetical protein